MYCTKKIVILIKNMGLNRVQLRVQDYRNLGRISRYHNSFASFHSLLNQQQKQLFSVVFIPTIVYYLHSISALEILSWGKISGLWTPIVRDAGGLRNGG